jgi:hypothetical protein
LVDADSVRYAVSTISDPDKMREFRDNLARAIRDDPNSPRGEKDSLLIAEGSIRGALVDPSIRHGQFKAWQEFLRENATSPVDHEVRPTLTRQARR